MREKLVLKDKRGFTILEALVALLILTIGLLGLLRVMPVGLKASRTGRDVTIATQLAQQKLDETRTTDWPATGTTSGNFGSEGYSNFEYILEIAAATNVNLREATVSVSWPAGASSQRTVALKTHMAKYD